MTSSVLPAPHRVAAPTERPSTLANLAEIVTDLHGFSPALVREIAARMPVHEGPFTLLNRTTLQNVSARHHTLGTLVVSAHLLLHLLHTGTGSHPIAIADLYAADHAQVGMARPPMLALLLLAPDPVLAREWSPRPPPVTVVEEALARWNAPTLIEVATALTRAESPMFSLDDD